MSSTGTPSVMAMTVLMPASTASRIASAVNAGGTKIIVASAPVFSTASITVSKTGTPSTVSPAFAGRDAADHLACRIRCSPWCETGPTLPVMPWQMTRVFLLIRMLMDQTLA